MNCLQTQPMHAGDRARLAVSRLTAVTLTGADERTEIAALTRLAGDYPALEVGLLYTATPDGRNRYPSLSWLDRASKALGGRFALHVCGRSARAELLTGRAELLRIIGRSRRVQVNGDVSHGELPFLAARVPELITQFQATRTDLRYDPVSNHTLLVDASGGRGLSPVEWERPSTSKVVGFAGGLGPDTIRDQLRRIAVVAEGPYWVDMEGHLRTNDWFDLDKCRAVLRAIFGEVTA